MGTILQLVIDNCELLDRNPKPRPFKKIPILRTYITMPVMIMPFICKEDALGLAHMTLILSPRVFNFQKSFLSQLLLVVLHMSV